MFPLLSVFWVGTLCVGGCIFNYTKTQNLNFSFRIHFSQGFRDSSFPHVAFSQCGFVKSSLVATATELLTLKMSLLEGREKGGWASLAQLCLCSRSPSCSHVTVQGPHCLWGVKAFYISSFSFLSDQFTVTLWHLGRVGRLGAYLICWNWGKSYSLRMLFISDWMEILVQRMIRCLEPAGADLSD